MGQPIPARHGPAHHDWEMCLRAVLGLAQSRLGSVKAGMAQFSSLSISREQRRVKRGRELFKKVGPTLHTYPTASALSSLTLFPSIANPAYPLPPTTPPTSSFFFSFHFSSSKIGERTHKICCRLGMGGTAFPSPFYKINRGTK